MSQFLSPGSPQAHPSAPLAAKSASASPLVFLQALWRRKILLTLCVLIGALAGFCWVVWQPPLYRATAIIELVGFNESFMGMNQFDPQAGTGLYSNMQTQLRVLSSNNLQKRVVERINLELTPVANQSDDIFGRIRNRLGLEGREPVEHMKRAIEEASSSMKPRTIGTSRLIEISCQSTSPEVAAAFLNAVASEYISQNLQFRSNSSVRTTQWLEGQVEEMKNRLDQATKRLQDFTRDKGSAFVIDENTLQATKLRQIQAELSSQQSDRMAKQLRYERARNASPDSIPELLDDATIKTLRFKLTELQRELAFLRTTLTNEHPKVKRVLAQIDDVEQTMAKEKQIWLGKVQSEYEEASRKERSLMNAYASQSRAVAGESPQASEFETLKREVEMARQNYNQMLQQFNQSSMVSAVPTNNVRIIDSATPSRTPFSPKPVADIVMGAFLGFLLPAGGIVLFNVLRAMRLSKLVGSPGSTTQLLQLPELAVIPAFAKPQPKPILRRRTPLPLPEAEPASVKAPRELAAWEGKVTMVAESFRFALTSLLRLEHRHPRPVFLVTSPGSGDGKTTIAANLAMALAESGRRVLLVDADLRRPSLSKLFDLPPHVGLKELILSDRPVSEFNLDDFVVPTFREGVYLLPAGLVEEENPGQMFFSTRLQPILELLRSRFDAVLIDTAPVLFFSDARLMSRSCDGVALVLRSRYTHHETAMEAQRVFAADGIPVLGTILNDWQPEPHEMRKRTGYYDYYHAEKN